MNYQVLANKWRPQTFSEVVGQKHVLTALINSLSLVRLHHAYLFSGARGVGKTTIARLMAKGLNCITGVTSVPCRICKNCSDMEKSHFVDLIEIDAASHTKVEDTRALLDNVQYMPALGRYKVYLIDEVHMLSRHSFNALLKTLEEPPSHVKFLLATTDPQKLPATVLSRCLQFHLKMLNVDEICDKLVYILKCENISSDISALNMIAKASRGSMRDALSIADQAILIGGNSSINDNIVSTILGTVSSEQSISIIEALVNNNGNAVMTQLSQSASLGIDWEKLLTEILSLFHRIAMEQILSNTLNDEDHILRSRLQKLANCISPTDIQLYYQILVIGKKDLPYSPDPRMGVEMTLLRALAFHPSESKKEF